MFYSGGKNFSPGLKPVTVQRGQGFLPESWSVRGLGRASLMSPCVLGLKTATRIFKCISWGQALTLFFIFVTFFFQFLLPCILVFHSCFLLDVRFQCCSSNSESIFSVNNSNYSDLIIPRCLWLFFLYNYRRIIDGRLMHQCTVFHAAACIDYVEVLIRWMHFHSVSGSGTVNRTEQNRTICFGGKRVTARPQLIPHSSGMCV